MAWSSVERWPFEPASGLREPSNQSPRFEEVADQRSRPPVGTSPNPAQSLRPCRVHVKGLLAIPLHPALDVQFLPRSRSDPLDRPVCPYRRSKPSEHIFAAIWAVPSHRARQIGTRTVCTGIGQLSDVISAWLSFERRHVDCLRPPSARTLPHDGRQALTRQTDGLDQHARGMGRDGLHVLDLDVLSAPVVQHQAEYPPADHAADRRRLEIAGPDLAAIRRGAGLEADVD